MMEQEIRAKYQPRPLERQVEFEELMSAMNQEQNELNRPFIDRRMEITRQRDMLMIQKNAINTQWNALGAELHDLEIKAKCINRIFHDLKHEWNVLNPREKFIKLEDKVL